MATDNEQPSVRQFFASDGYALHYRHWMPGTRQLRGYVAAVHGIQSHSGWYGYSSGRLCRAGFDVRFLDRRGSGLNRAARGDAPHAEHLVNDLVEFLGTLRDERKRHHPDAPVILLAISWGAKPAAAVCSRHSELCDAAAFLYPGIKARFKANRIQRGLVRLAESLGLGNLRIPIPLDDPALFTSDRAWQQFIRDDPLALREMSLRFLKANLSLDDLIADAPKRMKCPLLLMLAGEDRIVENPATRAYFSAARSELMTILEFPGASHTLEFEPVRERFVDELIGWMRSIGSQIRRRAA